MTSTHPILLALDFDNTIANTFEQSFGSRNVQTAYEYAIQDVLGEEGVALYRSQGGLNNRAPTEIVVDLGIPNEAVIDLTEKLVKRKLSYLVPEIGTPLSEHGHWPRLCAGFAEFWPAAKAQDQVRLAVVSNGHDEFINRVFELYRLEAPDAMVTDDDVRHRADLPASQRYKPDPFMLNLAAQKLKVSLEGAIYFGDNLATDGGMAKNAGIRFGHFDPRLGRQVEPLNGGFRFGDWRDVLAHLPELKHAR